jgi:DNA processing protein
MSGTGYWIGLTLVPEVGPVMSKKLLAALGSPENIFRAGINDLLAVQGISRERAGNIRDFRLWDVVEKQLKVIEKKGIKVVVYHDPDYPLVLKEIDGAPIVLYMKGNYLPEDRYAIAVVGSRKYTSYGESVTQRIASDLASSGFTIISGMARGVDTLSHKAALSSGGRTIAVLGTGLDVCYPSENRSLVERAAASGCVVSEFPPGTIPSRENFPRRNRLISGLSLGVLVVEATLESGSLITANFALEQNKEVFAVPGNITSRNSEGTNRLIKQGARVATEANDIIEELAPQLRGFIKMQHRQTMSLSPEEEKVCGALTREPRHIDLVSRETGLTVSKILDLLLGLELKGVVRQTSGKRFFLS